MNQPVANSTRVFGGVQVSNWALDDVFFDVGAWLAEEVASEFALQEGIAVIGGDGSNKPTGMTNTPLTATADFASPSRAAAVYEFVACLSTSSPAVAEVLMDPIIDLVYRVASQYRANGTFAMNSATAAAVRKLKDTNGQYLWQPAMLAGQPDRLVGYPVAIWEDMDDVATNALPIAFGDFRRGYVLVDRGPMRITVDEVTTPGHTNFYVRRRVGGIVANNDAVKFLKTTVA